MSYNKTMEELMVSARKLPGELSFDEVEFLLLNPTPPPPAKRPWWRGGYLKFLIMLTLLISFLSFFTPVSTEFAPPELQAFPIAEEMSVSHPLQRLPASLEITPPSSLSFSAGNPLPLVIVPTPKLSLAPAAAAEKTPPIQDEPLLALDEDGDLRGVTPPTTTTRMPKALFSGNYSRLKDKLMLTFKETEEGPVNVLFPELSTAELKLFQKSEATPLVIERATGSLLLYGDKKTGPFEFLPNTAYRESLNARGWGDAAAPDNTWVTMTVGKPTETEKEAGVRKPLQPFDHLWFRYFAMDVNDDYIDLLRQAGYDENELKYLWKLANEQLDYETLESLVKLSASVLTDTPPIEGLVDMMYDVDKLEELKSRGKQTTFRKFRKNNFQPVILDARTGASGDSTKNKALQESYARNWSLEFPNTGVDTISLLPGVTKLTLEGNCRVRINEDLPQGSIIAWGHKKAIRELKKKADYKTAIIINKRKRKTVYFDVPPDVDLMLKPDKGTSIELSPDQE